MAKCGGMDPLDALFAGKFWRRMRGAWSLVGGKEAKRLLESG